MRRFAPILILPLLLTFLSVRPSAASWWPWGNDTLVTIDGVKYTTKDFKTWWGFYNDKDKPLPKTPESYIDFLLLAREGERMHLADVPAFQHQTEVFLKVRSLMMLQQQEILSKIKITDKQVRERYEKRYTPIWRLVRLDFVNEKAAKAARKELKDGKVTIDNLEIRPQDQGGPIAHQEEWRRPADINKQWADIFRKLPVGGTSEPIKYKHGQYTFYVVKEIKKGSAKDLAKGTKTIKDELFKQQQDTLTKALIFRLRNKYDVKVDEKRLAALDIHKPLNSYGDAPIITSNHGNITEKQFMSLLLRDQSFRNKNPHSRKKPDDAKIKRRVLNGIIDQYVTDWECLARHYEKKEPFKAMYRFNIRDRLTNAVKDSIIATLPKVTKEEVKKYYEKHIQRYTQPEMVDLVLIQDKKKGDVNRVWDEVAAGADFFKTAKKLTDQPTKAVPLPFPHLNPALQKVVASLAKDETSRPFTLQGKLYLVHLTKRTPARPIPLEQVKETIRKSIRTERIRELGKKYFAKLKAGSNIKVNESNWQKIQKELGGTSK